MENRLEASTDFIRSLNLTCFMHATARPRGLSTLIPIGSMNTYRGLNRHRQYIVGYYLGLVLIFTRYNGRQSPRLYRPRFK